MKYAFFPGCTLESAAEELMISTKKVAEAIGVELIELDGWTCCGASHIQDIDESLSDSINARNIALAEEMSLPLLTVCNTCTLMLKNSKTKLDRDDQKKKVINQHLEYSSKAYQGTSEVTHFLWMIIKDYGLDELKKLIRRPLSGLKVANFYGCHIIRPADVMGFEDPLNPRSLEMVVEALGAEAVDYDQRLACCGFHSVFPAEKEALSLTAKNCNLSKASNADCIVTPCPLCQMQLDMYQPDAQKMVKEEITMPILHLPQLIGLALGFEPEELGIKRHIIDVMPNLKVAIGIV
ncbi:CoB--CoM heterodisulfide reductase iron-sulfur subunit B family protein [Salisediminibacterium beveridgei]|uniref:Heterodisulfide reductase subunit B n=1 Tax=Salisediminibacterium beveridgei TaxID=632773 RepID=A0A1D7QX37_9BACI|nr:CoB--CoM heterodisulfide reductase iron-sulfur subunit B family protein [Salisediminibacterium beveridgei]AOM83560.1 heterodisulfide reductase subunit B [Salisediminibacterium beveridgei]